MIESSSLSHLSRLTSHDPLPPRLSMDAYADFVEASLRDSNPVHAARQKALEERIRAPFCMGEGRRVAAGDSASHIEEGQERGAWSAECRDIECRRGSPSRDP
jgi:hypothetical protein